MIYKFLKDIIKTEHIFLLENVYSKYLLINNNPYNINDKEIYDIFCGLINSGIISKDYTVISNKIYQYSFNFQSIYYIGGRSKFIIDSINIRYFKDKNIINKFKKVYRKIKLEKICSK
jgi:hypothetical protein